MSNKTGGLVLYYRRNLQGDITGLVDAEGSPMGEFIYDAYGNFTFKPETDGITGVLDCIISFALTPISYRGYAYTSLDSKHCYYYLGSRFYSPLLSRFMNADSIPDTGTGVVGTNMFAYCNNNPVEFIDPNGHSIQSAFQSMQVVFSKIICFFGYVVKKTPPSKVYNTAFALVNYNFNIGIEKEYEKSIIYGQGRSPYNEFKIGASTVSKSGCEVVAVYNALLFLDKPLTLSRIIYDFEYNGWTFPSGVLGSNPDQIHKFFKKYDIKYEKYNNLKKYKKSIKRGNMGIISFWNEDPIHEGLHTVFFIYTGKTFLVYNYTNYSVDYVKISTVSKIIFDDGKFIVGYIL